MNSFAKRLLLAGLTVWQTASASATGHNLRFEAVYLKKSAEGYKTLSGTDTLTVNTLRFYITHLSVEFADGHAVRDTNARLLDFSETSAVEIAYEEAGDRSVRSVEFDLGVDSATNVAGVQGDALDPTNGMYWTWQSGYINFKIEGTGPHRPKGFEYHIGGYLEPYPTLQHVKIAIDGKTPCIGFSLEEFFRHLPSDLPSHVMSPGTDARRISVIAANSFISCGK